MKLGHILCNQQTLLCAKDLLLTRTTKEPRTEEDKETPEVLCRVKYLSGGIGKLQLGKLFRDKEIQSQLPVQVKTTQPAVSYSYTATIRKHILNHKKTLRQITPNEWAGETETKCKCSKFSQFVNPDLQHIMTGNLDIVHGKKLRNLRMSKNFTLWYDKCTLEH